MIAFLILSSLITLAQDKTAAILKDLCDKKQYKTATSQYASNSKELSAEALYYVGLAYYFQEDDNNCLNFLNLSIQKNPKDPRPYYIKGFELNYVLKYTEALACFSTAISLNPKEADYYIGMADSYSSLKKFDEAIANYKKATQQKNCSSRAFIAIPQIYMGLKNEKKALEAYYVAKAGVAKTSDDYSHILSNIGILESKMNNEVKAEQSFLEMITLYPNDFDPYTKLIQVYYKMRDYDKAKPYKEKLYEAHKKGLLVGDLADKFCIEQFPWKDKTVSVYERFEEGAKKDIYEKHIFYVSNAEYKVELKVQTEYSPISIELGGPEFLLCAYKGDSHYNSGVGFSADPKYQHLRAAALEFIEKLMK